MLFGKQCFIIFSQIILRYRLAIVTNIREPQQRVCKKIFLHMSLLSFSPFTAKKLRNNYSFLSIDMIDCPGFEIFFILVSNSIKTTGSKSLNTLWCRTTTSVVTEMIYADHCSIEPWTKYEPGQSRQAILLLTFTNSRITLVLIIKRTALDARTWE